MSYSHCFCVNPQVKNTWISALKKNYIDINLILSKQSTSCSDGVFLETWMGMVVLCFWVSSSSTTCGSSWVCMKMGWVRLLGSWVYGRLSWRKILIYTIAIMDTTAANWNVEDVERKRAAKVPQTHAAERTPARTPNADALSLSAMLSAWNYIFI